jgi:uncharacterized protein (DUF983 family)
MYWCPRCKSSRILRAVNGPVKRGLCMACGARWVERDRTAHPASAPAAAGHRMPPPERGAGR